MWEVAKHERRKRVAGNNSQVQLSKLPSTTVTLVDECTAKTMDEIIVLKIYISLLLNGMTGKLENLVLLSITHFYKSCPIKLIM